MKTRTEAQGRTKGDQLPKGSGVELVNFVHQVEDRRISAVQVLTEQQAGPGPNAPARIFIP